MINYFIDIHILSTISLPPTCPTNKLYSLSCFYGQFSLLHLFLFFTWSHLWCLYGCITYFTHSCTVASKPLSSQCVHLHIQSTYPVYLSLLILSSSCTMVYLLDDRFSIIWSPLDIISWNLNTHFALSFFNCFIELSTNCHADQSWKYFFRYCSNDFETAIKCT